MKEDLGAVGVMLCLHPSPNTFAIYRWYKFGSRGTVVIAGGGGGIPVVRDPNGVRKGVTAVIDKDLTSALMGNVLGIDTLMILTAVPKVAIHFGTEKEECLDRVTLQEIRAYHMEGHFPRQHGTKNRCCNPVSRRWRQAGYYRPNRSSHTGIKWRNRNPHSF